MSGIGYRRRSLLDDGLRFGTICSSWPVLERRAVPSRFQLIETADGEGHEGRAKRALSPRQEPRQGKRIAERDPIVAARVLIIRPSYRRGL